MNVSLSNEESHDVSVATLSTEESHDVSVARHKWETYEFDEYNYQYHRQSVNYRSLKAVKLQSK